jgi:hypothetical protein
MLKVVTRDEDAITHDPWRMPNAVSIKDVIDLDEGHLR